MIERMAERRVHVAARFDKAAIANMDAIADALSRERDQDVTRSDVLREALAYYVRQQGWRSK
jgi:hypothetical protein